VVQSGASVRRRWALVEDPRLTVDTQGLHPTGEVVRTPPLQDALFERDEVEVGVCCAERHGSPA
jgi:hypothetical protein